MGERWNFYKIVFHFINTIKSKRATDVLKYPTEVHRNGKIKIDPVSDRLNDGFNDASSFIRRPVIDLFGKVFEENCTTAFAKSIPCIFYVNRPRSFYILPRNQQK